jgi:hypothetical protein
MRKVVAAAVVTMIALASSSAYADADADAADIGSDAFGVDAAIDSSMDVSLDIGDVVVDASDALDDTAVLPDTFVEDTTTEPDTAPADTAPEATPDAKADTRVPTVLDSAGPIIDHVNDGGWDPRGRTPAEGDACTCDVPGARRSSPRLFGLLLPLLAVVLRRRRR